MTEAEDTLFDPLDKRKSVSIAELAEAIGIDTETARRDVLEGTIPGGFQRKHRGAWRVRRSVLEEWWKKQGTRSTPRGLVPRKLKLV